MVADGTGAGTRGESAGTPAPAEQEQEASAIQDELEATVRIAPVEEHCS